MSADPLYVNFRNLTQNNAYYVAILDNNGVPIKYLEGMPEEGHLNLGDFQYHAATNEHSYHRSLITRNQWGRANGERVILASNFDVVEVVTAVGLSHTDPHDFQMASENELVFFFV